MNESVLPIFSVITLFFLYKHEVKFVPASICLEFLESQPQSMLIICLFMLIYIYYILFIICLFYGGGLEVKAKCFHSGVTLGRHGNHFYITHKQVLFYRKFISSLSTLYFNIVQWYGNILFSLQYTYSCACWCL